MSINFENNDSLSLNLFVGGNPPDADLSGSGVRPLAAFKVEISRRYRVKSLVLNS